MKEIEDDDYKRTLTKLLDKKAALLSNDPPLVRRDKLARYAISKGYESDLVWKTIDQMEEKD